MNRRGFLSAVGLAASTGLAGCAESQNDPSTSSTNNQSAQQGGNLSDIIFESVKLEGVTHGDRKLVFTVDPSLKVQPPQTSRYQEFKIGVPNTDFVQTQQAMIGHSKYSFKIPNDAERCRLIAWYLSSGDHGQYMGYAELSIRLESGEAVVESARFKDPED